LYQKLISKARGKPRKLKNKSKKMTGKFIPVKILFLENNNTLNINVLMICLQGWVN